jgi:DNA polymerase III alpha subunit|tara:strand:- start:107 stop:634 length:528 start_codon:yes stop_codon:yes gene_type:complete
MNMLVDKLGVPRFTTKDIINLIYEGNGDKLSKILVESSRDTELYNESINKIGNELLPLKEYQPLPYDLKHFDQALQSEWFMPDKYQKLDIRHYLEERCETLEEVKRVDEEYIEYEKRGLLDLLRFLIYLVAIMRENNVVWGVGRGSSVASYILYLIGIHKINSIQYELDWHEFMR